MMPGMVIEDGAGLARTVDGFSLSPSGEQKQTLIRNQRECEVDLIVKQELSELDLVGELILPNTSSKKLEGKRGSGAAVRLIPQRYSRGPQLVIGQALIRRDFSTASVSVDMFVIRPTRISDLTTTFFSRFRSTLRVVFSSVLSPASGIHGDQHQKLPTSDREEDC
jgi:hypothetical protein